MIWLLGGYIWLYVHRPFEVVSALGTLQLERGYMLLMMLVWLVTPNKGFPNNRIHLALAFFAAALLATWIFSPHAAKPGAWEIIDNFAKVGAFYFLFVTTVRDEKSLRFLALMVLVAVGLYMVHSAVEYVNGRHQYRQGIRRLSGVDVTFGDPNFFASTLLYSLPMLLPFWCERPRRFPRWLLAGYALFAVGCILLTGSRAGFLGALVLGVMLYFATARSKVKAALLGVVLTFGGVLTLAVALPEELQNRYLTLLDSSRGPSNAQESADGRLDGFLTGVKLWNASPFVGHGPGGFAYAAGRGSQAHNLYGQVLSEMGLLGATALLLLLLCFWLNHRESARLAGGEEGWHDFTFQLSRAVTINVLLMLVMGWAGHNLYRYNWQWLAAFSGVTVYCLRRRAAAEAEFAFQGALAFRPALQVGG